MEMMPMSDVCFGSDVEMKALNCRVCAYFFLICQFLMPLLELISGVTEEDLPFFLIQLIMENASFYNDLLLLFLTPQST